MKNSICEVVTLGESLAVFNSPMYTSLENSATVHVFKGTEKCFVKAMNLRQLVDPIGAGDGFVAGYLSAWLEKRSLQECLRHGNAVGSMVCQTDGDWEGLPTRTELDEFLTRSTESNR